MPTEEKDSVNHLSQGGIFASLKSSAAQALEIGKTRLELLGNELQSEKIRVIRLLILAQGAMFSFGLAIILGVLFLSFAFLEHRLMVFGLLTVLFFVAAFILLLLLKQATKTQTHAFVDSVEALEEDIRALRAALLQAEQRERDNA